MNEFGFGVFGFEAVHQEVLQQGIGMVPYPKETRDRVVTALKAHNLVFNILGYLSPTRQISGIIRMGTGLVTLAALALKVGIPKSGNAEGQPNTGLLAEHRYREALHMAVAQVARGAIEAFVPYGGVALLVVDIIATPCNISNSLKNVSDQNRIRSRVEPEVNDPKFSHRQPEYSSYFCCLNLV